MADQDWQMTPKSVEFLNQWATMNNASTITPVSATGPSNQTVAAGSAFPDPSGPSPEAGFADNPPLFTCAYCPFILLDAVSLEEHERLHHQQSEYMDLFDDQLCRQLLEGMASLPASPQEPLQNNTSGSINVSGSESAGRQFGRSASDGQQQASEMQHSISPQSRSTTCASLSASPPTLQRTSFNKQDGDSKNSPVQQVVYTSPSQLSPEQEPEKKKSRGKSGKGKYKCEHCGKVFGYQQNLNQHRRLHTGEKYTCNVCHKDFNFSQNLHQHMRVHSGKKEYECPYCPKEFNDAANFHRHKRVIHGITCTDSNEVPKNVLTTAAFSNMQPAGDDIKVSMPFSCPRCAMCFVLDSSLQKHLLHCVNPTKDNDQDDKSKPTGSNGAKPATGNTVGKTETKAEEKKSTISGEKRKREQKPAANTAQKERKQLINKENIPVPQLLQTTDVSRPSRAFGDALPQTFNQFPMAGSYPETPETSSPIHYASSVASMHRPQPSTCMQQQSECWQASPKYSVTSPQPQMLHGFSSSLVSPLSSPTHQSSSAFIFVCPYCSFGVTNNVLFHEHLMHHCDSIYQQYHTYLTHGQTSFDVIISNIMTASVQVINPTVNSPLNSFGSNTSSVSPAASPPHHQALPQNTPVYPALSSTSFDWPTSFYHCQQQSNSNNPSNIAMDTIMYSSKCRSLLEESSMK